jgi:endonuclease G
MQPQNNKFNAGIWATMENQIRTWANNFDTLFVCKGGTIDKAEHIIEYVCGKSHQATRVNADHVPVPKYFFMAVLGKKGTSFKATGFWIAQDNYTSTDLKSYAVTIQALQNNTGIDFFCNLPDDIENQVETVAHSQMEKEWVWIK